MTTRYVEGNFLLQWVATPIDDCRFPGALGGAGVRTRRVDVPCKSNAERPGFVSARLPCLGPPEFGSRLYSSYHKAGQRRPNGEDLHAEIAV